MIGYTISISNKTIDYIHKRVSEYPWNSMSKNKNWELGTDISVLKNLSDYWVSTYDW